MRHPLRYWLLLTLLSLIPLSAFAQNLRGGSISPLDDSNAFIQVTTADNISANSSIIVSDYVTKKSPMTDKNLNAILFLTRNITQSTAYHAEPYGVYYASNKWRVFNQTSANNFVAGVAFNVQLMGKGDTVFTHITTSSNTGGHVTHLNHPLLNNNPSALIMVTPAWNGVYNPNEIGVYYAGSGWAIFNQNTANSMPIGAMFNVQVLKDSGTSFTHTAAPSNIFSTSKTEIDNVWLNNNLSAQFLVTQNWSLGNTYNNAPIGVEYDNASNKWRIININGAAMPTGAGFNILMTNSGDVFNDGVLVNGGFEVPGTTKTIPVKWDITSAGTGSKRVCNKYAPKSPVDKEFALVGECAYLLKGAAGEARKLVQTVTISGSTLYNTLDFLGLVKGVNVTGAKIKGAVKLQDGTTTSYTIPGSQLNGSYDWKAVNAFTNFAPENPPVKLTLTISIGGGSLYLDDLSSALFITLR